MGAWALAAAFLAGELVRDWNQPGRAVASACVAMLRDLALGHDGGLVQIELLVLTTLTVAAVAVVVWRLSRSVLRARASAHDHARMARMAGQHIDGLEAVVLDVPKHCSQRGHYLLIYAVDT